MTNEEIRNKFIYQTFSDGKPYYEETDIDCVQNETRKDERNRVIDVVSEVVFQLWHNNLITDLQATEIKTKLNSLKQC